VLHNLFKIFGHDVNHHKFKQLKRLIGLKCIQNFLNMTISTNKTNFSWVFYSFILNDMLLIMYMTNLNIYIPILAI